jgi:hypothetical protein
VANDSSLDEPAEPVNAARLSKAKYTRRSTRIYTYFMQANITNDMRLRKDLNSRWDFEEKLKNLGHYPTYYKSIEDLKLQFQQQLNKLIEAGQI